jgi:hypothetical protein
MDEIPPRSHVGPWPESVRSGDEGEGTAPPSRADYTAQPQPPVEGAGAELKSPGRLALDAAFRSDTDLRLGLAENLSDARARSDRVDERVRRAFKEFKPTARATSERDDRGRRVEPGIAPFEAVGRAMEERLAALDAAPRRKGLAVRANSSLIQWEGATTGSIDLGTLLDSLGARDVTSLTLGTPSAVTACEAEHKARAIVAEIDGAPENDGNPETDETDENDDGGGTGGGGTGGDAVEVGEFVERSVTGQMGPATAPEERLTYGLIPNTANSNQAQAQLLDTFQLRPGPTDVTSYHDFSTLQIAFDDVWTRIFDGDLEDLGRQLYREYVGLLDFLGYDPKTADRPISSLDDLAWLISEVRALSRVTQTSLPGGVNGDAGSGHEVPKNAKSFGEEAGDWIDKNLPGGRGVLAGGTLGISELVLWIMREAATFGRKDPLIWDDLVHDRTLPRGDRIKGSVEPAVISSGEFELVLWTDISNRKEIAFQVWDQGAQKPRNEVRVANWVGQTVNHSGTGLPTWYVDRKRIPITLLDDRCVLEFASEQTPGLASGRYVLGDLDKIVGDGGRLVFYWKDS